MSLATFLSTIVLSNGTFQLWYIVVIKFGQLAANGELIIMEWLNLC
jgi:hypothetical protein